LPKAAVGVLGNSPRLRRRLISKGQRLACTRLGIQHIGRQDDRHIYQNTAASAVAFSNCWLARTRLDERKGAVRGKGRTSRRYCYRLWGVNKPSAPNFIHSSSIQRNQSLTPVSLGARPAASSLTRNILVGPIPTTRIRRRPQSIPSRLEDEVHQLRMAADQGRPNER
jgi:hypothetical protein